MSDQNKLPNEQGYWWWWNGDEDALPVPVDIAKDSAGNFFATKDQLGWSHFQFVKDMGGFWIRLREPSIATMTEGDQMTKEQDEFETAFGVSGVPKEFTDKEWIIFYNAIKNGLQAIAKKRIQKHPEAFCDSCGRQNVVWHAPGDIWNKGVSDADADKELILCPVCFIKRAENEGIKPTSWRVAPEDVSP